MAPATALMRGCCASSSASENVNPSKANPQKADMSSSRRRGERSRGNQPPPATPQFPPFSTAWSGWAFDAEYNRHFRCRQIAATGVAENDYEYEYNPSGQTEAPRGQASNPAVALAAFSDSAAAQESTQEYGQESSYTTDAVANLTHSFDRTRLSPVSEAQVPVPNFAVDYSQSRGRSNSFGAGPSNYNARGGGGFVNRHVRIQDTSTTADLDPAYKVRHSRDFVFGKVFKVLWSEPTGSTGTEITKQQYRTAKFGEKAYDSIRRFVVVDDRNSGHCICLPILTYGGQGCMKKGVQASDHAAIYTTKHPVVKAGEKMAKRPIRMVPDSERHKLDPFSRINYAKVYTVEHNVKVNFIGKISPKYEQQVTIDYNSTHLPLPDRPTYTGDMTDDDFGHAEGPDPGFPNQPSATMVSSYGPATTSNWPTTQNLQSPLSSPQTPYVPVSTSSTYPLSYDPSAVLENRTAVIGSQTFNTPSAHPHGLAESERTSQVTEETEGVEIQYEPPFEDSH